MRNTEVTDTEDESPREPRKRVTSCTDERNVVWHFEIVNPFWYFFSGFLISYSMSLAYLPHVIPFDSMGSFGLLSKNLSENYQIVPLFGFWLLLVVHLLEAIYVVHIANQFYINPTCLNFWFFQTLLCGYPSTRLMNIYAKKNSPKIE